MLISTIIPLNAKLNECWAQWFVRYRVRYVRVDVTTHALVTVSILMPKKCLFTSDTSENDRKVETGESRHIASNMETPLPALTCIRLWLLCESSLQSRLLCHNNNSWLLDLQLQTLNLFLPNCCSRFDPWPLLCLASDSVRKRLILSEGMAKEIPAVTFRVLMPITSPSWKKYTHGKYSQWLDLTECWCIFRLIKAETQKYGRIWGNLFNN